MARIIFWLLTGLYATLYYFKTSGTYWPIVSDHLADLICLPIVLSICRYALIKWKFAPPTFELTPGMVLAAAIYFSVVFEGLLPMWKTNHHADFIDILAYFLGGISYFLFRLRIQNTKHDIAAS